MFIFKKGDRIPRILGLRQGNHIDKQTCASNIRFYISNKYKTSARFSRSNQLFSQIHTELCSKISPLRYLTKQSSNFNFDENCKRAFDSLKRELPRTPYCTSLIHWRKLKCTLTQARRDSRQYCCNDKQIR